MKITGISRVFSSAFKRRQTSKPSIRGIITSRRMSDGCFIPILCKASSPLLAGKTVYPSLASMSDNSLRLSGASSTITISLSNNSVDSFTVISSPPLCCFLKYSSVLGIPQRGNLHSIYHALAGLMNPQFRF